MALLIFVPCRQLRLEQASYQPSVLGLQTRKQSDPSLSSCGTSAERAGEGPGEDLADDWWSACGMPWVATPPGYMQLIFLD